MGVELAGIYFRGPVSVVGVLLQKSTIV